MRKTKTSALYINSKGSKVARVDTEWVGDKPHTILVREFPSRKGWKSYWVCNTVAGEGSTAARLDRRTREVLAFAVKGEKPTRAGQIAWSKVPEKIRDILDKASAGIKTSNVGARIRARKKRK